MLKIKDNVDLKELEKFGFEEDRLGIYLEGRGIIVFERTRKIDYRTFCDLSILFDLIQAGLVEKVED